MGIGPVLIGDEGLVINTATKTIDTSASATWVITYSSSAITATIPPPKEQGVTLRFVSTTARAHKLVFTGSVIDNGVDAAGTVNQGALINVAGGGITVVGYNGHWYLLGGSGTTTWSAV